MVHKLGIPIEPLPVFHLFIGSGEFLVCKEVCRQVTLTLQNTIITKDLFMLRMGGTNVMLGIQWLEKLGLVTANHKELTMEFELGDQKVRLQGDPHLADSEITKSRLCCLMSRKKVAYFYHLRCKEPPNRVLSHAQD